MERRITEKKLLEIYDSTLPRIYSRTLRWTGGRKTLTEDVVQETYLRALEHWASEGVPDRPEAWLSSVARNLVISYFRKARPLPLEEAPAAALCSETDPVRSLRVGLLYSALGKMRKGYSSLLAAFHLEGKTVKEIAAEQRISDRAVEGRLRRGRDRLRDLLDPKASLGGHENE